MKRRAFLAASAILAASALPVPGSARTRETAMRRLMVFNNVSLDGYFTDASGDMSWAHKNDPEWMKFTSENAGGEAELVFGRITYEMMASFWPTPQAMQVAPAVAEGMNRMRKTVFSRSLDKASWSNTRVVHGDPATEVRKMKQEPGPELLVMGSGQIVAQLTDAGLVDLYQIVITPHVLGHGRTLFEGVKGRRDLKLTKSRSFSNGNVVLWYESAT
jgi:dihydrofolate reductase